jgi:uncharacterized HAD superfamily protein
MVVGMKLSIATCESQFSYYGSMVDVVQYQIHRTGKIELSEYSTCICWHTVVAAVGTQ